MSFQSQVGVMLRPISQAAL